MHRIHQGGHMLRRGELRNTVAQIEDMAGSARAVAVEHFLRFNSDFVRRGKKHVRIKIPLQCHLATHTPTRLADIDRPVQPNRIAT